MADLSNVGAGPSAASPRASLTRGPTREPRAEARESDDWVTIARVVKTQGRRGEVAAEILTDVPGRFDTLREVSLWHHPGRRQAAPLLGHWFHKQWVVLHLGGVDDMNAAETWRGAEVQVPRSERATAPAGQIFISDLLGCTVQAGERELGRITAVEDIAGAPSLLHIGAIIIPFVQAYIVRIDLAERHLELSLPEGLLEL